MFHNKIDLGLKSTLKIYIGLVLIEGFLKI